LPEIFILNIETSSTVCSVSLSLNGKLIRLKEKDEGYTHAEDLHVFIREILKDAEIKPEQLNAVAVGLGPGSYTGLRIGMSAAKGLCYALQIPLIGVATLEAMALNVLSRHVVETKQLLCPLVDARRMEVYCALYDNGLREVERCRAKIISEETLSEWKKYPDRLIFFGSGMEKCRKLLAQTLNPVFVENIFPSSEWMVPLSFKKFNEELFEDLAYSEPMYAKEFFDTRKDQKE
jgi:tRNA threonylcarbamoyladenosine biosynthesis protein TsaB